MTANSTINSTEENKMNYKYNCLNPIAEIGLGNLNDKYVRTEKFEEADYVPCGWQGNFLQVNLKL